jgi:oxygen-independent coproporphyrinogen-3 oxidase
MSLSLYIHIPFCLKRCIYCDFVSGVYHPDKAETYIDALITELSNIPDDIPLSNLYVGGGTPTALCADTLSRLLNAAFDRFKLIDNYEATVEANPGTLDRSTLHVLQSSGINRISLGVQSFNDDELDFLGRIHSSAQAEQAVRMAGNAGFSSIGIDFIYGIPGQTIDSWKKTLEKADSLKPQHISAYELTIEEGTVLHNMMHPPHLTKNERQKNHIITDTAQVDLLQEDQITEMYEHAIDYLTSRGYIHYEISNFALPGHFCRHNLNYWDRGEYYGAGLGAHSFIEGKRSRNTDDPDEYIKLTAENKSLVKYSEDISEDMAFSEAIFLGLRRIGGINAGALSRRYNKSITSCFGDEIRELKDAGLLDIISSNSSSDTTLKLTKKGLMLSNEAFTKFIL